MLNHLLTFFIFFLIGIEIREGSTHLKSALLPTTAALGGMVFPAIIFLALSPERAAWAVVMPTDVALALGALALLGRRVNPAVKLFLMTLAVADDFFSLLVMAIFYRNDLDLSSAFYTLGAAAIGVAIPFRAFLIRALAPISTFLVVPLYIWINLFSQLDFSVMGSSTSLAITAARVVGKVAGITLFTWIVIRFSALTLPTSLSMREISGIGLLSGMGMTVSIVIAEIAIESASLLAEVRSGLLLAALVSGTLGYLWLRFAPAVR